MASTVTADQVRRTETPNAVMTTFASPSVGGSAGLSMWQVEMRAGQQGPPHVFDGEQVWHLVRGEVAIDIGAEHHELFAGDTVVIPAGAQRRISAISTAVLTVCGHSDSKAGVPGEDTSRGVPAWIA